MAGKVGALFVALGLDDKEYKAGMSGAVGTAQRSSKLIQMNFSTLNFRTFLYGSAGVYALIHAIKGITGPSIEFESQLAQVSTMLDKSAMSIMPQYRTQLEDMSKQFGQSTETLSKGLYDILSATIEPTKAMGVLAEANKAAVAGITDTSTATTGIVTILKAYQLDASKAADVSDLLFSTVKRGRTTFAELAPSIGVVAASAAQAGLKVEELGAMLSVMTRAGLSTDMAVIALANMLNSFIKPTGPAIEAAHELGMELNTATLRSVGMLGVMQILSRATESQTAAIFGNIRGLRGINAAMSDTAGFAKDMEIMMHRGGMTLEAYQKQVNTTKEVLKRLGQTLLVDIVRPFTDALLPTVRNATTAIKEWAEANRTVIKIQLTHWAVQTKDAIEALLKIIVDWYKPALSAMVLMFGASMIQRMMAFGVMAVRLTGFINGLAKAFLTMSGISSLSSGVFGLGVLAVGGAVYIGVQAIRDQLERISRMKAEKGSIVETMTAVSDQFIDVFGTDIAAKNMDNLTAKFKEFAKEGKPFGDMWKGFMETVGSKTFKLYGVTPDVLFKQLQQVYADATRKMPELPALGLTDSKEAQKELEKMGRDWLKIQSDLYMDGTAAKLYQEELRFQAHRNELKREYADTKQYEGAMTIATHLHTANRNKILFDAEQDAKQQRLAIEQRLSDELIDIERGTADAAARLNDMKIDKMTDKENARFEAYKKILETKFQTDLRYHELVEAATREHEAIMAALEFEELKRREIQWEMFEDHVAHVLTRMVGEGELSAKKIGDAFIATFRRIAIEQAALFVVRAIGNFINPTKLAPLDILKSLVGMGTGGMVYKPSLALVGESGPERVLNPAETRRYNSGDYTDDHSNVEIHIHTDSGTLSTLNPHKFAQLYREAKRSQLLG